MSEGYESYSNDKTTCWQPPVCDVEGRSQHRKMTVRGRGNSPSPLSPSAHHSLTPPPPFPSFNCSSFISVLLAVFLHYFHVCLSALNIFQGCFFFSRILTFFFLSHAAPIRVLPPTLFSYVLSHDDCGLLFIISFINFVQSSRVVTQTPLIQF